MTISYRIGIDSDDDGSIDWGDVDGDNLSHRVIALEWRLGMAQPYDDYPAPTYARITLRNEDQRFSPEAGSSTVQVGKILHIFSDDGLTERLHFSGFISRIEPLAGDQGQRTAVIHVEGIDAQLSQYPVRLTPQINQRADEIIANILDTVPLRRRVLKQRWILGHPGYSELSTSTRLPDITVARSLETGKTVFAYAGDTWGDGIDASRAIAAVTAAERGRFFINRDGNAVFYNRHHLLLDTTFSATFSDDMNALTYDYGAGVVSQVRVDIIPRHIGPDYTVLWLSESAQLVKAGNVRRLTVCYRDADKRQIGALEVYAPRRGIDYQFNTQEDGLGNDQTARVDLLLIQADFSAAILEIRNNSPRDVYLLPGFQLLGTPLYQGDPVTVDALDYEAQVFYGPRILEFNLPLLDSLEQADQLARFELARRRSTNGAVHSITLSAAQHATQVLERTLFDRIGISESQTGHTGDYFIIAEAHQVTQGGLRHGVTWTLESALANTFWVLNQSRLNTSSVLAY